MASPPPLLFDYRRRFALRQRAIARSVAGERHFLWDWLADEVGDRLACTTRQFERGLFIGPLSDDAERIAADRVKTIVALPYAEEDRLPRDLAGFDLIVVAGTLDSVNDLPGALVQLRRALDADGLFLGAMFGAGSLAAIKRAMMIADGQSVSAHIHPQVELRAAADLLARTGFNLQVADRAGLDVRYREWRSLVRDLRDAGVGNCLAARGRYLGRGYLQRLEDAWRGMADGDGRVNERFELLHLSGWAPADSQPKPARRGSGQVSLVKLLDKSEKL